MPVACGGLPEPRGVESLVKRIKPVAAGSAGLKPSAKRIKPFGLKEKGLFSPRVWYKERRS